MDSKKHPIRNLTSQLKKHEAFSINNIPRITAFYAKLAIQEPFRIIEKANYQNDIKDYTLEHDPIFVIGHWRSGTSFLQYLLGQDPQLGYLTKFQAVFPDVFLQSENFLKSIVERIPDTLNLVRDAQNMSINLDLDSPSEIEIALTTMISPTSLHWGHIFPKDAWEYFNKYLFFDTATENEIEKWNRDYAHLITKVAMKSEGRQILIKSPGNACRIPQLLALYPNAKFIFIHRNPYDVFYSSQKLWNTLIDNLALQSFSQQEIETEIIKVYKKLMGRYIEQRSEVPDGQLAEIRFENFVSDPVSELNSVYEKLSIPAFAKAKPYFEAFLSKKTEGKSSNYDYDPNVINELNKEWKFAFEEWNYPIISAISAPKKASKIT